MAKRRRKGHCSKACSGSRTKKARKKCVRACQKAKCVRRCAAKRYGRKKRRAIAPGLARLFGQFRA